MNQRTRRALLAGIRAGWGAALLLYPDRIIRAAAGRSPTESARVVTRVLGVRHVAQVGATARWGSPAVQKLGLVADALHALTGWGFAVLPTSWRRAALIDGSVATLFTAANALTVGRTSALEADGMALRSSYRRQPLL